VADALQEKTRYEVKRHQIDMQPIRNLGEFTANVRLTMDLVPEIKIIVHREGEAVEEPKAEKVAVEAAPVPEVTVEETPAVEETVEEVPASESEAAAADEASETDEE
jgi:large subunit ribosomal protein L9